MKAENIKISGRVLADIWRESWRGKSIYRILLNSALRQVKLSGDILDLGSGSSQGSYNRFINFQEPHRVKYTDLYNKDNDPSVIRLDLEQQFPLGDQSFQAVTAFNVLEHIYNYNNLVGEAYRILRPGGIFVGGVPFLINYHPSPNDYWRYSRQSLENIFSGHKFKGERLVNLGYGPFLAAGMQIEFVLPRLLKPFCIYLNLLLDMILVKIKPNLREKYVLGYLFIFKKE